MEKLIKGQRYWLDNRKDVSAEFKETVQRNGSGIDLFISPSPSFDEYGTVNGYHSDNDGGETIPFYSGTSYEKA